MVKELVAQDGEGTNSTSGTCDANTAGTYVTFQQAWGLHPNPDGTLEGWINTQGVWPCDGRVALPVTLHRVGDIPAGVL
jgi:hypothetical protein